MLVRDLIAKLAEVPPWYRVVVNDPEGSEEVHDIDERAQHETCLLSVTIPEIAELEESIADLEDDIRSAESDIATLEDTEIELSSHNEYLTDELNEREAEIAALKEDS
jgi:chromosome segregation ATPase